MDKVEEILCEDLDVTYDSANDTVTFESEGCPVTIPVCDLWHVARFMDRLDIWDTYDCQLGDELTKEQRAKAAVLCCDRCVDFDEDGFYRCAEIAKEKA